MKTILAAFALLLIGGAIVFWILKKDQIQLGLEVYRSGGSKIGEGVVDLINQFSGKKSM